MSSPLFSQLDEAQSFLLHCWNEQIAILEKQKQTVIAVTQSLLTATDLSPLSQTNEEDNQVVLEAVLQGILQRMRLLYVILACFVNLRILPSPTGSLFCLITPP